MDIGIQLSGICFLNTFSTKLCLLTGSVRYLESFYDKAITMKKNVDFLESKLHFVAILKYRNNSINRSTFKHFKLHKPILY